MLASGALSDPVLIDAVVQHWFLAINHDGIAVELWFESPPICMICFNLSEIAEASPLDGGIPPYINGKLQGHLQDQGNPRYQILNHPIQDHHGAGG